MNRVIFQTKLYNLEFYANLMPVRFSVSIVCRCGLVHCLRCCVAMLTACLSITRERNAYGNRFKKCEPAGSYDVIISNLAVTEYHHIVVAGYQIFFIFRTLPLTGKAKLKWNRCSEFMESVFQIKKK